MSSAFPIEIEGRRFAADLRFYQRQTLDLIRQQADSSREPGEASLNPEDLWRRSQSSFDGGAGQEHFDLTVEESDRERFWRSKGIDPWTRGRVSLLPDTTSVLALAGGTGELVVCGNRLYVSDSAVRYTTNLTAWTAITGLPGTVRSMCSDGFTVYIATTAGIYTVTRSNNTPVLLNTLVADLVAMVKGRLMVAAGPHLYNITDTSSTVPPVAITAPVINSDWRWTCFGEAAGHILIGGLSGDKSAIYRLSIRQDGTALGAPASAAELPDGEIIRAIEGYVGVLVLGTTRGVRVASADGGMVGYGPLVVETSQPVLCIEPQGDHAWFGWSAFDATSTGLGRLHLGRFVRDLRPAFASDLMVAGAGDVASVVTFGGRRVFSVAGQGVYRSTDSVVASGVLEVGRVSFDLADPKAWERLGCRLTVPTGASVSATVTVDGVPVTRALPAGGGEVELGAELGEEALLSFTLTRGSGGSPELSRWTLRAAPVPRRGELWVVPLILEERVADQNGVDHELDPKDEFLWLKGLEANGTPVTYTEFGVTHRCFIDGVRWGGLDDGLRFTRTGHFPQGLCALRLRSVA